jgi:hypothetical protein
VLNVILFNIWMLIACGYALARGGAPERIVAVAFLVGVGLTVLVQSELAGRFQSVEVGILVVDIAFLAIVVAVALLANRYWPLWVVALQTITVAVHGVKAYVPHLDAWMYHVVVSRLAWVILALLVIGTWRHRTRLRRNGTDSSWSRSSRRSEQDLPSATPIG